MTSVPSMNYALTPNTAALGNFSVPVKQGRVEVGHLHRLRPVPTSHGTLALSLRQLQTGLAKPAERRLLDRLGGENAAASPDEAALAQLWQWASPAAAGTAPFDKLAVDRCALACSLWPHFGEQLVTATQQGDVAVLELFRQIYREAQGGPATAKLPQDAGDEARMTTAQWHARKAGYGPRMLLPVMLLAWGAPAALDDGLLLLAMRKADVVARAYDLREADAHLLLLRIFVGASAADAGQSHAAAPPTASHFLNLVGPTFFAAAQRLSDREVLRRHDVGISAETLLLRLHRCTSSLAAEDLTALQQDATHLPWQQDPPEVQAQLILTLAQLEPQTRRLALQLLGQPATEAALRTAACPDGVSMEWGAEAMLLARLAVLYAAYSMALGQLAGSQLGPNAPSLRLQPREMYAQVQSNAGRSVLAKVLANDLGPVRTSGMRALHVYARLLQLTERDTLGLLQAACVRAEALPGQAALATAYATGQAVLEDPAPGEQQVLQTALLLRLLSGPLPTPPHTIKYLVTAFFGENSCADHADESLQDLKDRLASLTALLRRGNTGAERAALCALVREVTQQMGCRTSAIRLSQLVAQLQGRAQLAVMNEVAANPDYDDLAPRQRAAYIEALAAAAGQPVEGHVSFLTSAKGKATAHDPADFPGLSAEQTRRLDLEARRRHSDAHKLRGTLVACAATLLGWSRRIDHTQADAALGLAEQTVLMGAAATLALWCAEPPPAPGQAEADSVRCGLALVWQHLAPVPVQPYWALPEAKRAIYRTFFAALMAAHPQLRGRLQEKDRPLEAAQVWPNLVADLLARTAPTR